MNLIKIRRAISIQAIIGSALFIILTTIAMIIYPGGNSENHYSTSYNFIYNYFSDLGRTTTFLGDSNLASRVLFTIALTIVGITIICYYSISWLQHKENKLTKWLSILASINGIFFASAYIGIAYTPYDVALDLHVNFVYISFTATLLTMILYTIILFLDKSYPNFYAWIYAISSLILVGYLIILYGGDSFAITALQVIGQKVIVYTMVLCILIQAIGTLRFDRLNNSFDSNNTLGLTINKTNLENQG